jgi:hypothetical protein
MRDGNALPLPQEILDQVLDSAARTSRRRIDCAQFCLISKQFVSDMCPSLVIDGPLTGDQYRPAIRSLLRDVHISDEVQGNSLRASWARSSFDPPLVCTRRMYMRIGGSEGLNEASARDLLAAAPHLQTLAFQATAFPEDFLASIGRFGHLHRLEIDSAEPVAADPLLAFLAKLPMLQRLSVRRLTSTLSDIVDLDLPLRSLTLTDAAISDHDLLALARSCKQTIRSLVLHGCKSVHRGVILDVLQFIGPGLTELELRSCVFLEAALPTPPVGAFFDRIPDLCPFLLELQICSDNICTVALLPRALTIMPLRHLELNCRLPHFEPSHLLEALASVPTGRLETLFVGPHVKWNDEQLALCRSARLCSSRHRLTPRTGTPACNTASPTRLAWTSISMPPIPLHLRPRFLDECRPPLVEHACCPFSELSVVSLRPSARL